MAKVPLFRSAAIEHQIAQNARADVLQIDPRATNWGGLLCLSGLITVLAFLVLGRLNEYATGPAVVRLEGRTSLTAHASAYVSKVYVMPGARVREGEVLVQFYASEEAAELEAARREFDGQLRKLLQQPHEASAREALVSLRARRELAERRLETRTLRAPFDGVVGDVRVRPGELVEAGGSVVELVDTGSRPVLTALLPGRYRPYLAPGMSLRLSLDGARRRAQELTITRVGDQIVGPSEAARYLGRDLGDSIEVSGPVVLVQAALPSASFRSDDDQVLPLAHGMQGKAESAVRDEPLAYVLVPALRQWVSRVRPRALLSSLRGLLGIRDPAERLMEQE